MYFASGKVLLTIRRRMKSKDGPITAAYLYDKHNPDMELELHDAPAELEHNNSVVVTAELENRYQAGELR